jgi:hypothetical protein
MKQAVPRLPSEALLD